MERPRVDGPQSQRNEARYDWLRSTHFTSAFTLRRLYRASASMGNKWGVTTQSSFQALRQDLKLPQRKSMSKIQQGNHEYNKRCWRAERAPDGRQDMSLYTRLTLQGPMHLEACAPRPQM